jgi:hypothetical protein
VHQPLNDLNTMPSNPEQKGLFTRYLAILAVSFTVFAALLVLWGVRGRDHFAQIPLNGDMKWYRNYSHMATREMQDRDVLFSGIGKSIENLKRADIVILGHSVLQFAIRSEMIDEFQEKHGVRIYNLTNPGIASGEYARRMIRKWKINPKIWLINADDHPALFFSPKPDDFFASGRNSAFKVVETGWLQAYLQVASRGVRWHLEDLIVSYGPAWLKKPPYAFMDNAAMTSRNIETGNFNLDRTNGYLGGGPLIKELRDRPCPVSDQEIGWAKNYLAGIGGTPILTLVPYDTWCPQRLLDIAEALDVESFMSDHSNFSAFDGRHMTKEGAIAYTTYLLAQLEQTRAFKLLKGLPDPGPVKRAGNRPDPNQPVTFCLSNNAASQMFVSVRFKGAATDHVVAPGATLKLDGSAGGQLCSDVKSFNRDQCPNPRSQAATTCP